MYNTVTKIVKNVIPTISDFRDKFMTMQKQNTTISGTLSQDIVFGYAMYPANQFTDTEIENAMRYNDSKDTDFRHFIIWYEVEFVYLDFNEKQILCCGSEKNVQYALEGIQEILSNALHKKLQNQNEQLRKETEQKRLENQKRVDEDKYERWVDEEMDKDFMENKHS